MIKGGGPFKERPSFDLTAKIIDSRIKGNV